jgi:hypothetical protein
MDPLEAFKKRKADNKAKVASIEGLELIHRDDRSKPVTVIYNAAGDKIKGSLCVYCYARTKLDPWRNGAYVFTICRKCFADCSVIEDSFTASKKDLKVRRKMVDPDTVEIDWDKFEKWVENKQAKLVDLAKSYKIYPKELKEKLVDHYGDRIQFKRGRGGGIALSPAPKQGKKKNVKAKRNASKDAG